MTYSRYLLLLFLFALLALLASSQRQNELQRVISAIRKQLNGRTLAVKWKLAQ
jgi:hypothetical protein